MELIDKQLSASYWYNLTNTWDFSIVSWDSAILQAAQNRILASIWSWIFDDDYWSLMLELRNTPVQSITNEQIRAYIEASLQPMMDASQVLSIVSVEITDRWVDSIQVEVKLELDLSVGILNINIVI